MGCKFSWVRRVSLETALAASLVAGSAGAVQGGDPGNQNSCYSHCGDTKSATQKCYCDAACESKGDCCADKHEWCAPAAAKPFCSLTDEYQKNQTATGGDQTLFCGSDLGYSFIHNNRIELLFGDSWEYAGPTSSSCIIQGADGRPGTSPPDYNDDAQARMPLNVMRPTWVPLTASGYTTVANRTCSSMTATPNREFLEFDKKAVGAAHTYQQIRLKRQPGDVDIELGLVNTPLTGFSDGVNVFAMFLAAPPEDLATDKHVYVAKRRGEGSAVARTTYDIIADLGYYESAGYSPSTKFLSVSSARITSIPDTVRPTAPINYETPTVPAESDILIWGRPRFFSNDDQSAATNGLYLMRHHITAAGLTTWAPQYFNGNDTKGMPTWTNSAPGVAVLTNDFKMTNHLDVKWIKELNKWVMLYGGDVADYFNPPTPGDNWNPPGPGDQPRHGAIHMRTADNPGGPWSRPTPVFWREGAGRYLQCGAYDDPAHLGCDRMYDPPYPPGDWEPQIQGFVGTGWQDADCQTNHPHAALTPNLAFFGLCTGLSQRGNLYAPSMFPSWTRHTEAPLGGVSSTTIYFALSTFYPYDVFLAAVDLNMPRVTYPLQMQIRQSATQRMIAGSATPAFSTTAGGSNGGAVAFRIDKFGSTGGSKMKVGDIVTLRHVNDANKLLVVGVGSVLSYVADTASPPTNARWRIMSTSPDGTLVGPSTVVRLRSESNPTLFIRSTNSSTAPSLGATNGFSDWRFTYHCQPGEVLCTR